MGILDRISTIVKANVNDLLDKAENPEAQLNYFIMDMADSIKQSEQDVQNAVVQTKMLQSNANESRKKADDWAAKAEKAVRAGRDDLAREALRFKDQYDQEATNYDAQYVEQQKLVEQLRQQLSLAKTKYDDVQRARPNLIARYNMAKITNKVVGEKDPVSGVSTGDYDRMSRKIDAALIESQLDNRAANQAATESEINKLSEESNLDDELAALKSRIGLGKTDKPEEPGKK